MNASQNSLIPFAHRLYQSAEIRQIECAAKSLNPHPTLMQRAGASIAALALTLINAQENDAILVLAGPGDNGGDALETAALLAQHFKQTDSAAGLNKNARIYVIQFGEYAAYSVDAQSSLHRAKNAGVHFIEPNYLLQHPDQAWCLVIDGLFGLGLSRPIVEPYASLIKHINQLSDEGCLPVLAIDIPSGLHADFGSIIGSETDSAAVAIRASHTMTLIANKPGLHTGAGKELAGDVKVDDLAIDQTLFPPCTIHLNHPSLFQQTLRPRRANTHKGSFGEVLIIGGADGMQGAALLSARAALNCGAGRVHIGFLSDETAFDPMHPELMCRHVEAQSYSGRVVAIGPGLGQSDQALQTLTQALQQSQTLVLDADALNLIAANPALLKLVQARKSHGQSTLATPHPLEAARLLGISANKIQQNRLEHAKTLAHHLQAIVILKGAGSIIVEPTSLDEQGVPEINTSATINPTGNPALATAGTGDVLTGVCAALLAQHWRPIDAARAAVWLHGEAADQLVRSGIGPIGITASEFIPAIRESLNRLIMQ